MTYVEVDRHGEHVALLRLARVEKLNAIDAALAEELADAFARCDADEDVRAIVVGSSTPRAFSAGADLSEQRARAERGGSTEVPFDALLRVVEALRTPTVAAIAGYCYGAGLYLAVSLDLRICDETATFKHLGVSLGIASMAAKLTPLLGPARTKELVMTADTIGAAEAERIGLVNRVVPPGEAWAAALELGQRIAAHPPAAVQAVKRVADVAAARADAAALESSLRAELVAGDSFRDAVRDRDAELERRRNV